ncbi:MAG: hypothetical protein KDD70_19140 [Bdellovibrionales bacterium]|nr:hypothetical protein [Bdellovibrionales bacterium]
MAFTLALCSIAYELLLGQTLSAFLGNTVLRYSVTIGLYMMSMGIGALFAKKRILEQPLLSLQTVELLLSVLGSLSLSLLFFIHALGIEGILFSFVAHALIVVIGVLTGLELPLLFAVSKQIRGSHRNIILGIDYLGGFAGTLLFAFYLYPSLGLFASTFLVAAFNAFVGVGLIGLRTQGESQRFSSRLCAAQVFILCACVVGYLYAENVNSFWLGLYTG